MNKPEKCFTFLVVTLFEPGLCQVQKRNGAGLITLNEQTCWFIKRKEMVVLVQNGPAGVVEIGVACILHRFRSQLCALLNAKGELMENTDPFIMSSEKPRPIAERVAPGPREMAGILKSCGVALRPPG